MRLEIYDPNQDYVDSLGLAGEAKRCRENIIRLRARLECFEKEGVSVLWAGLFPLYKSDTRRMLRVMEDRLKEIHNEAKAAAEAARQTRRQRKAA